MPAAGLNVDLDYLLPEQWAARVHKPSPEMRLMWAVMQSAIEALHKGLPDSKLGKSIADEAAQWILEDNPHWPYSFVCICAELGLEPLAVRKALSARGLLTWDMVMRSKVRHWT